MYNNRKWPIILILILGLLIGACSGSTDTQEDFIQQDDDVSINLLLTLLENVPQDARQSTEIIFFTDYATTLAAYDITPPPDAASFANDLYSREWWAVISKHWSDIMFPFMWGRIEDMEVAAGFTQLQIQQSLYFYSPPEQAVIYIGDFDADAITDSYQTHFDFVAVSSEGVTVWCWTEGCDEGLRTNMRDVTPENPFGGRLGRRPPMVVRDNLLMSSPSMAVVREFIRTETGDNPSLAELPAYRAVVNVVNADVDLLQAAFVDGIALERAIEPFLPVYRDGYIEGLLVGYQDLPQTDLLMVADTVRFTQVGSVECQ